MNHRDLYKDSLADKMSSELSNREALYSDQMESLDEKWFDRFKDVASFQAYEYLNGDEQYRALQKEKFMKGEIDHPVLDYPNIDLARLESFHNGLLKLKDEISREEENEILKATYIWRINEKLAEVQMLLVTKLTENPDLPQSWKESLMARFKKYSEFIYGKPDLEVHRQSLTVLKSSIDIAKSSSDSELKKAAEDLEIELGEAFNYVDSPIDHSKNEKYADNHEIITEASKAHVSNYSRAQLKILLGDNETTIFDELSDSLKFKIQALRGGENVAENLSGEDIQFSGEEVGQIFDIVLKKSLRAQEWKAIVKGGGSTTVNQEKAEVRIPVALNKLLSQLQALIVHELGTHVWRRLNAEKSKLKLLQLGLDRYEAGEEGVATMKQHPFEAGKQDFSGFEGHFATSLVYGLDRQPQTPRNFREVYSIMEKHFYLKNLQEQKSSPKNIQKAKEDAQKKAWDRCIRTFRGTDCNTPGICFTKDMIYREGNIGAWKLIGNSPDELLTIDIGKFDPSNPRHLWILFRLGVRDKDLSELDQWLTLKQRKELERLEKRYPKAA